MYSGGDWTWLVVSAVVGMIAIVVGAGALVGVVITLPFALWMHDLSILVPASAVGAVIAAIAAGLSLLGPAWANR